MLVSYAQYLFLVTIVPVSYTHLDVYKRQGDRVGEFSFEIELGSAFLSNLLTVVNSIAKRTFFSGEVKKTSDLDLVIGSG